MRDLVRSILLIAAKDLRIELRTKESLLSVLLFASLLVIIFSVTLTSQGRAAPEVIGGVIWVTLIFSATVAIGRVFDRERHGDAFRALLLTAMPRGVLYLGKLASMIAFMSMMAFGIVPLLLLLFDIAPGSWLLFSSILAVGIFGFAILGTFFAAPLMHSRGRDLLLSVVTYPLILPLALAGAQGTARLLISPIEIDAAWLWLKLMISFDLVFLILSMWFFGPLVASD